MPITQHTENVHAGVRSQLISGFLGNASTKLGGTALALGVSIILARVLGPSEYGVYAYVIALVSLLAMPVQAGLSTLVIRETAYAARKREWSVLKGLWRWSAFVAGGLALLIAIVALIGLPIALEKIPANHISVFFWGLALVPLMAWGALRGAALTGLNKVVLGQLPDNILRPGILLTLLLCGFLWLPGFQPSAVEAMILTVSAGLLGLIIIAAALHRNRPTALDSTPPLYRHKAWLAAIWPLTLIAGIQVINSHADIVILGFFTSSEEVGIYRIVTQTAILVVFALQIVNTVAAPHFARMHAAGETAELQRLITRSAQITLLGALPVAFILILFGNVVLEIMFGDGYVAGHGPLAILAIGQLVNAGMGSVGLLLNMTGHEREAIKGVAIAAFVNIPLNLILIPVWGTVGAASATAVSLLIWNIVLWHSVRQHLGLNSTAFGFANKSQ